MRTVTLNLERLLLAALFTLLTGVTLAMAAGLEIKTKEGVGGYLADDKGMTLYLFKKDTANTSVCTGTCVEKWPVYYNDTVVAPLDTSRDDFGMISREDGTKQTTYKGMPLYYYFKDKEAGDVNGQGVGNVWYVVAP